MSWDEFESYPFLRFDEPRWGKYKTPTGQIARYSVPVYNPFTNGDLLGYLPLPLKYFDAWVDLCYLIVYYKNILPTLWNPPADLGPFDEDIVKDVLLANFDSSTAMLKYLLFCRGKIMEEIFETQGQVMQTLPTFDEYIIKNRFDYHWLSEDEMRRQKHIFKDPFSKQMEKPMSTPLCIFITDFS
jgi:hypothetical protein